MWWNRRRLKRAMIEADGLAPSDPARSPEVRAFQRLSRLVQEAAEGRPGEVPPFEQVWAAVEQRLHEAEGASKASGLHRLLERRPVLVLAPVGAFVLAALIGVVWWARPDVQSSQCFVDSYDFESGTVIIDQDPKRPDRPTVIWHAREEG